MLKIISNRHKRKYIPGFELSEEILKDFDWLDDPRSEFFIKYNNNYYHLSEFMPIEPDSPLYAYKNWSGYLEENFWTGIVIQICKEFGGAGEYFYRIGYYMD